MLKFEGVKKDALVCEIVEGQVVQVLTVAPIGEDALRSNEARYGLNQADKLFQATVLVADESATAPSFANTLPKSKIWAWPASIMMLADLLECVTNAKGSL